MTWTQIFVIAALLGLASCTGGRPAEQPGGMPSLISRGGPAVSGEDMDMWWLRLEAERCILHLQDETGQVRFYARWSGPDAAPAPVLEDRVGPVQLIEAAGPLRVELLPGGETAIFEPQRIDRIDTLGSFIWSGRWTIQGSEAERILGALIGAEGLVFGRSSGVDLAVLAVSGTDINRKAHQICGYGLPEKASASVSSS